ncbi:hypothetical protein WBG78_25800 [Chryseolinea sp. T2]|uniref:hypothetical protein n=1 Tax=Chryseolinea sp. T2 TaxID=3129255 RepID=UPI003077E207
MKKHTLLFILPFMAFACSQDVIELDEPVAPDDDNCISVVQGSADFSKFIAIGSSYTAGFQAGALFNDGQNNSLPAILNKQFECAGAPNQFNQPSINTANGFNIFVTPNPVGNVVLGRMLLQGATPRPTPQVSGPEAIPNPAVNPSFIYTGSKTALNNFGIQAIVLGHALIPETGNWAGAGTDPRFSPFYGRLAYPGTGTSTLLTDAIAAHGSFFLFWLGMDDFLLNAAFGGDPTKAPLTTAGAFDVQYKMAVNGLLASNANLKGVVVNYPNIFKMPHFTLVAWNAVPLDAATATALTSSLANNYNAFLDGVAAKGLITSEEATKRKISYASGQNAVLITDETLTDLSPYMAGPAAALLPYARARQTTSSDILPFTAGSVIGTAIGGDATKVYGVSVPLPDQYALIPTEIMAIESARTAFNATVKAVADANSTRVAYADVDQALEALIAAKLMVFNNVSITPNINPPTGIYSEDGIHPNSRGYAFLSTAIISAINTRFGSTLKLTDLSKYQATGLPIP